MWEVNTKEKEDILLNFPSNIKLSYENIIHKKVLDSNLISVIPQGKKCFVWFTQKLDEQICYLLLLDLKKKKDGNPIKNSSTIINAVDKIYLLKNISFDFSLSYGTILFGTLFHYQKLVFFSIEDLFYNQGINVEIENFDKKLLIIKRILDKKMDIYSSGVLFGLPLLGTNFEEIIEKIKILPYKIYCLLFRKNNLILKMPILSLNLNSISDSNNISISNLEPRTKTTFSKRISLDSNQKNNTCSPWKKEIILKIRPDIQNDIYHVFCLDENENEYYIDVAYIPDYKTSVLMNSIFRKIKENINLDSLEESDEEDEFENDKEDRFVYLDREFLFSCKYHYKFKKWIPIKKVIQYSKPMYYNDFMSFFQKTTIEKKKIHTYI